MVGNLAGAALALVVAVVASRSLLPGEVHNAGAEYLSREWLTVSLPLLAMAALHMVAMRVDILMLGFLAEPSEVGIYAVATRVAGLSLMGLVAANSIAGPLISEQFARGSNEGLQSTASRAARLAALISLPIVVGLVAFGRPILGLFGPGFSAGYYALTILLVGQTANVLFGPVGLMMTMTGHQLSATAIFGVALVGNVVLNWVLIPIAGIQGAAIATAATTAGWNLAMFVYVVRRLEVRSFACQEPGASRMNTPNPFTVGTPRCGTSSLYHYLAQRPNVASKGTAPGSVGLLIQVAAGSRTIDNIHAT